VSSSKTARLHRRQAARRKKYKRLRKSGRVPRHTRAERRRAEAERQRQREAERFQESWLRWRAAPAVIATGAASSIALFPLQVGRGHYAYQYVSAGGAAGPSRPDLPHPPDTDPTFYPSWSGPGTTTTARVGGPVNSVHPDGSERYGWWGPNILG
jgi:hypothetical protein